MKSMCETWRENPWKLATIILGGFVVLLIASMIYDSIKERNLEMDQLCLRIEATPAWVDSNGILLGYGALQKIEEGLVDKLIQQKIRFVYNSDCSACQIQIQMFGTEWKKYQNSDLTLNCK